MEPHLNKENLNRWRLLLGENSKESLNSIDGYKEADFTYSEIDDILGYLYNREYKEEQGYRVKGGQGSSQLTVPTWIRKIRTIFPKKTVEILEKQAIEKYNMTELLTDKKVLEKLEPTMTLLKNILQFKGYMKGEVVKGPPRTWCEEW